MLNSFHDESAVWGTTQLFCVDIGLTFIACFAQAKSMNDRLKALEQTIRERRDADPSSSYVASLRTKGRAKMAEKVGEEAIETVIAAVQDDRNGAIGESADLLFHLMVLIADMDITLEQVVAELARREGLSGLEEKASRGVS